MQTIRERSFFGSRYIEGPKSRRSPYFFFGIGVPIGGSVEAIKSLESILGIDLESISAEVEGGSAGVRTTSISTSKL